MAEAIHFIAKPFAEWDVISILLSGHAYACIKVIHIVESHHGIFLYLVIILVPMLIHATKEHSGIETHTRRDTDVFE